MKDSFGPADALALSGADRDSYLAATRCGNFAAFPTTTTGVARQFDADDVVAFAVEAQLERMSLKARDAWKIANELRVILREAGDVEELYIAPGRNGKPRFCRAKRPATGTYFTIPVRQMRATIAQRVADRAARTN
jgi:hypothetical protein